MKEPLAYGSFVKKESHVCRTSAYIQWGTSDVSIGSCLLLNPGSADFQRINPALELQLDRTGQAQGEVRTDPTMGQLIAFVERICGPSQLDGRFHIYNLFTIQNSRATSAIDEFKRLVESGDYDASSALVPVEDLEAHPWIMLGWGCDEKSFPSALLSVKERWLRKISDSGIPYFGKEHPKGKGYYHPCPLIPTRRFGTIEDLVKIYQTVFDLDQGSSSSKSVHVFPVRNTKPTKTIKSPLLDVPQFDWQGWVIMKENPEGIVRGFRHLQIDPRFKLRAYQYVGGSGANGLVWAIPQTQEELPLPGSEECEIVVHGWQAPKPKCAMDDFMEAITGDKTPISYLQAAILVHELMEFGADWHGVSWGTHRILPFNASTRPSEYKHYSSEWTMELEEPELCEPHFYYSSDGQPTIVFHTVDCVEPMTINRFIHTFSKTSYTMSIACELIASGSGGIIF
jgi:hypothetical protein